MDRNILKKIAIEARKELMQEVTNKIKTYYINQKFEKNISQIIELWQ